MKSTVLATLTGLAFTNSLNKNDLLLNQQSSNLDLNSNSALNFGSENSLFLNNMASSGFNRGSLDGIRIGGAQNLAVTSFGSMNTGAQGLSSGTGLSNIGTGAVLVSPAITGTQIKSGPVITNGNFPKADIGLLSSVSSSVVNNNLVASGIINNARTISSQFGATRSINSLFNKLPSLADIDNMILSADAGALIQTIQAIGTSDAMPCDQRISYLLEILGRLKAAVAKKTFANSQVKIIIDAANKQIIRLTGLIDANNAAIGKLDINGLKKQLQDLLNALQDTYIKYNNVQSQIPTIQAQISGSDNEIVIINKNSDAIRNSIANDKIKLTTITADINSIKNRIKQLKNRQVALQAGITKGEATITKNDADIADINTKIEALQAQIRDLTNNADKFSSQAKDLEVKVSRIRTDISVNEAKRARIFKDNQDLSDRLAIEKKKNVPEDLATIQDMITALRNLVPKVQSEIDRHYYYCFGQGKVQVQTIGGVVVYVVRGQAFGNYLKNLYGQNIRIPQVSGNVMFNRVNIFDQDWSGAFGYPFNENAFATQDLSLAGSFGCMNPSALVTGSGTITQIGANYIQTLDQNSNQKQRFKLGSCSRLQSTRKVPAVGQKFYYSGFPDGSAFNLYAGSCLD